MKPIKSYIPNTITCLNLLMGCLAVILSFHQEMDLWGFPGRQWVYVCIGAAAVFDFCDGLAARTLRAYSALGKELDSLSDLVSFGVAPGMLIFNAMLMHDAPVGWAITALIIPLCGGLRLAKFNVDDTQSTTFRGLPIPANAIFWIGFSAWIEQYSYPPSWLMAVIIALISLSMVSNIRMFSLKFKSLALYPNIRRYAILFSALAFVLIYGVSGLAWTILLYILISVFSRRNAE